GSPIGSSANPIYMHFSPEGTQYRSPGPIRAGTERTGGSARIWVTHPEAIGALRKKDPRRNQISAACQHRTNGPVGIAHR
ncbi:MAG: hypothetical protein P8X57_15470, partial [Cyclobacteriaceae bacterium]